jgi:hypothetical protein
MKNRGAKPQTENPFLQPRYSYFYPSVPLEPQPSKAALFRRVKESLEEMHRLCRGPDDPLFSGETVWPSREWLEVISRNVSDLAKLLNCERETIWKCITALAGRQTTLLRLRNGLNKLVDRAAKFYAEPLAIAIQKRGIAGDEAARRCFAALKRCSDGRIEITSVNWEEYRHFLNPRSGESCEVKAAQICLDLLRNDCRLDKPWLALAHWLAFVGNSDLAARLTSPSIANAFNESRAEFKNKWSKILDARRRKKFRLRRQLEEAKKKLEAFESLEAELVREELAIIDFPDSTKTQRSTAARDLKRNTGLTPDQWRKILVKKA